MADQDLLHTSEIMKAAMPYIETKNKGFIEMFVKVFDLMGTMRSLKNPKEVAALGLAGTKIDFEGLLNAIRPLCSLREREFVDRFLNFFQMKRMFDMYNSMMETMKTMQEFGGFNFSDSGNDDTDNVTGNFSNSNFESIFEAFKNFSSDGSTENQNNQSDVNFSYDNTNEDNSAFSNQTNSYDSQTEVPKDESPNDSNSSNKSNNMMFEMLKNMVPPEQKSTFENISMLLNTMSYDNSSKTVEKEHEDD
ncbi:MAG: hypothetical protein K0R00_3596 [Herbinix sp.]|nr:hypothetical protein [Herbinix sp.]